MRKEKGLGTRAADVSIRMFGDCPLDQEALRRRFADRGVSGLRELPGEYVIVVEDGDDCHLISSESGAVQYYYTVREGRFFHDETVLGVLRRSGLSWRWNWQALADLTILDHVVGDDTLHPDIQRVPPASVLHFQGGALTRALQSWEDRFPAGPSDPQAALTAFNGAVRDALSEEAVVSMSGGFDSRAILSSAIAQGARPACCPWAMTTARMSWCPGRSRRP